MEYEAIVVELKIIATIQIGMRLNTKSSYLNIEPSSLVHECLRRWKTGDSRYETVRKINIIINKLLSLIL